jgi:hypothetical protein
VLDQFGAQNVDERGNVATNRSGPCTTWSLIVTDVEKSTIPDEARSFGKVEGVYRMNLPLRILGFGLFAFVIPFAVAVPILFMVTPTKPGVTRTLGEGLLLGAFFLVLGLVYMAVFRYYEKQRVLVFEHGLADVWGRRSWTFPFTDVKEYWDRKGSLRFVLHDDRTVTVCARYLGDLDKLKQEVERKLSTTLFPELRKRFERGEEVPFGPFVVSQSRLLYGTKEAAWPDIDRIDVFNILPKRDRYFQVLKKGNLLQFCYLLTYNIPNSALFLELAEKSWAQAKARTGQANQQG